MPRRVKKSKRSEEMMSGVGHAPARPKRLDRSGPRAEQLLNKCCTLRPPRPDKISIIRPKGRRNGGIRRGLLWPREHDWRPRPPGAFTFPWGVSDNAGVYFCRGVSKVACAWHKACSPPCRRNAAATLRMTSNGELRGAKPSLCVASTHASCS